MSNFKAAILGCSGLNLTNAERSFYQKERPFGFILFNRNLKDPDQIRALCFDLRAAIGDATAPILIDQEGGRVQRLRPPLAPNYPHARSLGQIYKQDKKKGLRATWLMSRLHAFDLMKLGVNVNCLPVLDIPTPEGHDVIGKRAYGEEVDIVCRLGQAACDGLKQGGVLPVIKHIPGHGRASGDTHYELPVVETDLSELERQDFAPFKAMNNELMAMTAHVVYSAIDRQNPATTSKRVVSDIIRKFMGFDGLLMSDDLSMAALSGDFSSRTRATFQAGCDVVLHCNGSMDEMAEIMAQTPYLQDNALRRADLVRSQLQSSQVPDAHLEDQLRDEFRQLCDLAGISCSEEEADPTHYAEGMS